MTRLPFDLQTALWHRSELKTVKAAREFTSQCHNLYRPNHHWPRGGSAQNWPNLSSTEDNSRLATEQELSDFLKSVERRAFKRSVYHVRNEESALDIVQDSMMKLAEHYGDKPAAELPLLFQRILSNCTLDWFRRQKTRNALFSNLSDFESDTDDGEFDLLGTLNVQIESEQAESPETSTQRAQTLHAIESEIQELPARQREAFLMRYWEELDVAETAAAMGCSEGSVKTHCSRAVQALGKALRAKGITA